jgi:enoyl-[acyl-carrier protein] reductase/trans-2-enoyl-CoA reductase (NAD+)
MLVEPKVRGFICATAHPVGCEESVIRQIGASTGYGLATRIATTYTYGAATLGVMFEKPATDTRTATPGYYNTVAFEKHAKADGYYAKSINGDAFSDEIKLQTIETIKEDLGEIDLVIYSIAAPRRTTPEGITYSSVLKASQEPFTNRTLDLRNNELSLVTIPAATKEEEEGTIKVMGGEDWKLWMDALKQADVLAPGATTIAYSYIGPKLTYPIYYQGTIGMAKRDLYETSLKINQDLQALNGRAYIAVNKALVTQASSAIPVVPLYISILYTVMKKKGLHEGCIEQMDRLFYDRFSKENMLTDEQGCIRMDDYELQEDVQAEVEHLWDAINQENLKEIADIDGYWEDFYHMFGFHYDNVDYTKDVEI